jgi:nitroreductase
MELMEAISGRRSVRDYFPQSPPQEALLRLIDAAIRAPNAVNRQPWFFAVVRDQALLDRISRDAKAYMTSVRPLALPEHLYEKLADPDFHVFYHAPALIVISAAAQEPWIVQDCALAAENLMLAAHGLGLGSCWIGLAQPWLETPQGKQAIGLPETHAPVAPIAIGRPKSPSPAVPREAPKIRWIGREHDVKLD